MSQFSISLGENSIFFKHQGRVFLKYLIGMQQLTPEKCHVRPVKCVLFSLSTTTMNKTFFIKLQIYCALDFSFLLQ